MRNELKISQKPVLQQITDHLDRNEFQYRVDAQENIIFSSIVGNHGRWDWFVQICDDGKSAVCFSTLSAKTPAPRRQACAELLTRINHLIKVGAYELDFVDGEVRFRTSVPIIEQTMPGRAMEYLIMVNLAVFDDFMACIYKIIHSEDTPEQVLTIHRALNGDAVNLQRN
jgi:hypothetical protein